MKHEEITITDLIERCCDTCGRVKLMAENYTTCTRCRLVVMMDKIEANMREGGTASEDDIAQMRAQLMSVYKS